MAPHLTAIVVAAGRGTRMGGETPKQWLSIGSARVIDQAIRSLARASQVDDLMIVLHPEDLNLSDTLSCAKPLRCIAGGATRDASVRAALEALEDSGTTHVLIHDAARPQVPAEMISRLCDALRASDAAAPALPVTDALWRGAEGQVTGTQDRTGLYRAQTPQAFRLSTILEAHRAHPGGAADDVEVARAAGIAVRIVTGDETAFKITYPGDIDRAARQMETPAMDIRTGNGFDVHRFGPGDHVILCGVEIPHDRALQGHSDADVGMHAVTDAIYGALGDGDIGQHFPPSEPQWKGAASEIFLRHAVDLATTRGYRITHMDCTLICERPKIGPHHAAMKEKMAHLMTLETDRISVKATTSEQLGFTGRGEGIAALATVTLVRE